MNGKRVLVTGGAGFISSAFVRHLLEATPYEAGEVLPHERTHAAPKEGRLRLLRATRTQLEPIFLLYDAEPPVPRPVVEPDLDVEEGGVRTRASLRGTRKRSERSCASAGVCC